MPTRDGTELVVCRVEELPPGKHRIVQSPKGRSIAVFNVRGSYPAIGTICPHQGGPLGLAPATGTTRACLNDEGQFVPEWISEGQIVRCGWHLYEFDVTSGRALADEALRVATYPVKVVSGAEGLAQIVVHV